MGWQFWIELYKKSYKDPDIKLYENVFQIDKGGDIQDEEGNEAQAFWTSKDTIENHFSLENIEKIKKLSGKNLNFDFFDFQGYMHQYSDELGQKIIKDSIHINLGIKNKKEGGIYISKVFIPKELLSDPKDLLETLEETLKYVEGEEEIINLMIKLCKYAIEHGYQLHVHSIT